MKRFLSYVALCALLLSGSCTKDGPSAGAEGTVSFRISVEGATRVYDPMQTLLIRIYNADGGLIRRYTSLDEMPRELYLVAGDYRITVDAGDRSAATWTNKTYHGERAFAVAANKAITETVLCPSLNVGAEVTFDATATAALDKGVRVYISARDEFSMEELENVPTLDFDASTNAATGYFLIPEGTTNLSWNFHGEGTKAGVVDKTGVIENVESATIYKLKFQYSKTPDGFADITVTVDKSTDKHYDDIGFSPQPMIKGENCSMSQPIGFNNNDLIFAVSSIRNLTKVTLKTADTDYLVFDATGNEPSAEGIAVELLDSRKLRITVTAGFWAEFATGVHPMQFDMTDSEGGKGSGTLTLAMPGLLETTSQDYDLWSNTARFNAIVTTPGATGVKIACRIDGGEWKYLPTVAGENFTYTAELRPKWIESTNGKNLTIYSLDKSDGLFAGKTYEYKLVIDGTDDGVPRTLSTVDAVQSIPYGDMENSGLSCFTSDNTSAPAWGSGNNSFAAGLCTQSTYNGMQGSKCAKMTAAAPVGILAAGNLFTGLFAKDGLTTGVVSFGQPYNWTARPTAMKVKYYAEKVGIVDVNKHSGAPIGSGDQDRARIFVALVSWNNRHVVASGTSAPTGVWDPEQTISTGEGRIIAYGSLFIGESSTGGEMLDVDIPLHFYDKTAKPSGNYTLVVSCSTSAYGDYMVGCQSNVMYVDDFRWEY